MHVFFERGEQLNEIFPKFFKEALHRLEKIEQDIMAFKESEVYKELMNTRKEKSERN